MPRISVKTAGPLRAGELPEGFSGEAASAVYFKASDQLQLHSVDLEAGRTIQVEAGAIDRLIYVWQGSMEVGGCRLAMGSSMIAERSARVQLTGGKGGAVLLVFASNIPTQHPHPGGNVHLLPAERAPRTDSLGGSLELGGVMHADADCPTCTLWLHENHFPSRNTPPGDKAGIHSHSEDEIIFVTRGEIRLGQRLYGPGTALAVAADTLYSFTAGPHGLHFVNFRAKMPGDIYFPDGRLVSETQYWREHLPRPNYLRCAG